MEHVDKNTVRLFWTGGWDSTFRLLQLLLSKNKVQTFYIIDEDRLSTYMELHTMRNIKRKLFKKYPETKERMLPTIFKSVYDIKPNLNLTKNYDNILNRCYIGRQYEWLAKFCYEMEMMNGAELCAEKAQNSGTYKILKAFIVQSGTGRDTYYKFDEKYRETDEYEIFRFFSFPLFNLTKIEMQAIAKDEGFEDFLELTWFCHMPKNNRPSGVCTPCSQAIEYGLGRRIPLSGRIRYYFNNRPKIFHLLMKRSGVSNLLSVTEKK